MITTPEPSILLDKLGELSPNQLAEVERFVDLLIVRNADLELRAAMTRLSEAAFSAAWDNTEDAAYDRL